MYLCLLFLGDYEYIRQAGTTVVRESQLFSVMRSGETFSPSQASVALLCCPIYVSVI